MTRYLLETIENDVMVIVAKDGADLISKLAIFLSGGEVDNAGIDLSLALVEVYGEARRAGDVEALLFLEKAGYVFQNEGKSNG